jgi:hypothetical protein
LPTRPAWSTHISANAYLADTVSRARHRDICNLAKSVALHLVSALTCSIVIARVMPPSGFLGGARTGQRRAASQLLAPLTTIPTASSCATSADARSMRGKTKDGAQAKLLTKRRKGRIAVKIRSLPRDVGEADRPLAELGGGGRRTHRANHHRTALNAAVSDVFQIIGCGAVAETRRFDGHKYHPVTALCAGEHQARQAGRQNVLAVHGADSFGVAAQGRGISRTRG